MENEHKIILKVRTAIVKPKGIHKYCRIFLPHDIVELLGITEKDKEVYITLYEGGLLKIQANP